VKKTKTKLALRAQTLRALTDLAKVSGAYLPKSNATCETQDVSCPGVCTTGPDRTC